MKQVCRQIFTKWFDKANAIRSDAERLRSNVVDDVLKNLIEQTNDLKKFLEFERRQYEVENQKVNMFMIYNFKLIIYLSKI